MTIQEEARGYHGPQNHYVNNLQGANSCNCDRKIRNLATLTILLAMINVIVNDAFAP